MSTTAPKIGLALGSGASRGWAHIGVIKTLLGAGIEPSVVCGTSVGAIIGGAHVAGNLEKLEQWVLGCSRSDVLRFFDINLTQSGFVDTERLSWFLHNYVAAEGVRIEDLPNRYAAVSTNLETGREIWILEGELSNAVRASMSLPGLFPAVRDEHRWLVDGGLVNPVPVSTCRALGADVVIAVNLNSGIIGKDNNKQAVVHKEIKGALGNLRQQVKAYSNSIFPVDDDETAPGLFYAIANSVNIFQDRITRSRLARDPADVLISPKVAEIGMLEFHRAEQAIAEGAVSTKKALQDIHRALGL